MYLSHGGDVYTALLAGKKAPLDFSYNINPQGLPRTAVHALKKHAVRFSAYPDPLYRRLRAALSLRFGVPAENIVCGAGAADLIYRLTRLKKPRKALSVQPSFAEYEKALGEAEAAVERFYLAPPDFDLDASILPRISGDTGMIFLCNPNNPTGKLLRPELVGEIAGRCRETGTLLVIDECFLGFAGEAASSARFLDGHPGLVVLNAFTKTYALAGLRLGFALFSDAALAAEVAAAGQAWPCSLAAEYAALAALEDPAYLEKSRALIQRERRRLEAGLSALGFEVLNGAANFLFFRLPDGADRARDRSGNTFCVQHKKIGADSPFFGGEAPKNAPVLCGFNKDTFFERLLERGILVRDCANYPSLEGGGYFRIAIKKPHENRALLTALRSIAEGR
jgi:threonine-phosphate decarboxylase